MRDDLPELEDRLGYRFHDPRLLDLALTHGSASPGSTSNQRLEFLGDAVLGLVVCEALYHRNLQASVGELTEAKSRYVNNSHLARVARSLDVGPCLRLGKGASQNAEGDQKRLLSDALEAIVGAVYLDGGLEDAASFVQRHIAKACPGEEDDLLPGRSSKTVLQEWLQARGQATPAYAVLSETGPSHERTYKVEARCGTTSGFGEGGTKKAAEERAAADALGQFLESECGTAQQSEDASRGEARSRSAALAVGIGLALLGTLPVAYAGVSRDASQSAVQKLQGLSEGGFESGATVELSEDEMNSFLRFDAASTVPKGVEDLEVSFREGGAVISATVDLEKAGASLDGISPLMRLLMKGTRSVVVDADYSASDGHAVVALQSITVEGVELSGPLLEWFVESLAPRELQPYVMGERIEIEGAVSEIRLEPGRALIVVE